MGIASKATDSELLCSYAETQSIWKTALRFGMCGQAVHRRLSKLNAIIPTRGRRRDPKIVALVAKKLRGRKRSLEFCTKVAAAKRGIKNPNWKGGRTADHFGYIYLKSPNHPYKNAGGYVFEHRLIIEKVLGRYLFPQEVVHHINQNKSDNRLENLLLLPSSAAHLVIHRKLRSRS